MAKKKNLTEAEIDVVLAAAPIGASTWRTVEQVQYSEQEIAPMAQMEGVATMAVKPIGGVEGQKVERKFFETWVKVGEIWELQGRGIADSSKDLNPDTSKETDILGYTDEDLNKFEPTQNFDPNSIRCGALLSADLLDKYRRRALSEFKYDVLNVYLFLKDGAIDYTGTKEADLETACSIIPQSLGGDSYVNLPFNISYSNIVTMGTATYTGTGKERTVTFTPNAGV